MRKPRKKYIISLNELLKKQNLASRKEYTQLEDFAKKP